MTKILDNVLQPDSVTCQSAAICRVIGDRNVARVRSELLVMGEAGSPFVMGEYLRPRVKEYRYKHDGSLRQAIQASKDGYHLITHGWFTWSGHVLGLRDYNSETQAFVAEDPWYEFDFPSWRYTSAVGDDVPYSLRGIWAACVAGISPSHASDLYGGIQTVDLDQGGMWLHLIKN